MWQKSRTNYALAKKPGLPPIPKQGEERVRFDGAVKESLEVLMGRRQAAIKLLETNATADDVLAKVNELLTLLQG